MPKLVTQCGGMPGLVKCNCVGTGRGAGEASKRGGPGGVIYAGEVGGPGGMEQLVQVG